MPRRARDLNAAKRGLAIELDGDPWRQDLGSAPAKRALEAGRFFAADSDAHSGAQLVYAGYALAHTRRAGIPRVRLIITWPAEKLIDWARHRSGGRRRR